MNWVKMILLFQAVVTLILGIAFFAQVLALDIVKVSELRIGINSENTDPGAPIEYIDIKQRYFAASYILLFVSIMELIMVTKLLT